MNQELWTAVDSHIAARLAPHDEALAAALKDSADAGLPAISVSAAQGKLLQVLRAGLADTVDVRVGKALDLLPAVKGPFDLSFIDADKANIPAYFDWAVKLSRPGALIVVDNVVRGGRIVEEKHPDPNVQGVRRFFDALKDDRRVSATAIQTVGAKGYDGFALAYVVESRP